MVTEVLNCDLNTSPLGGCTDQITGSSPVHLVQAKSRGSEVLQRRLRSTAASTVKTTSPSPSQQPFSGIRSTLFSPAKQMSSTDTPGKTPEEISGIVFSNSRRPGVMRDLCAAQPAAFRAFMQSFVIGVSFGVALAFLVRTFYVTFKWMF